MKVYNVCVSIYQWINDFILFFSVKKRHSNKTSANIELDWFFNCEIKNQTELKIKIHILGFECSSKRRLENKWVNIIENICLVGKKEIYWIQLHLIWNSRTKKKSVKLIWYAEKMCVFVNFHLWFPWFENENLFVFK